MLELGRNAHELLFFKTVAKVNISLRGEALDFGIIFANSSALSKALLFTKFESLIKARKMRRLITTLAVAFFGFTAMAQEKAENPNAPTIDFEKEVVDYGTIEKGADGKREFIFTNNGKEPLIITNARGSCGCTVPSWPREPIAPGESGVIKVKYDTQRVGPINKSVTVNTNASTPVKVLRIKGKVVKPEQVKTTPEKERTSLMAK